VSALFVENAGRWESWSADVARSRTRLIFDEPALYRRFLEIMDQWETVLTQVLSDERGTDPSQDAYAQLLAGCAVSACRVALRSWLARPERSLPDHMTDALNQLASGFGVTPASASECPD
jgi:transcriptional regulator MftR-like protein